MRLDPIREGRQVEPGKSAAQTGATGDAAFRQALAGALERQTPSAAPRVEFSKHALERLEQRGIRLDDDLLGRLGTAIDRAAGKGARTTLVLIDQTAFVVGVPNRTVVTAADQNALREKVFTNIDSMVIA